MGEKIHNCTNLFELQKLTYSDSETPQHIFGHQIRYYTLCSIQPVTKWLCARNETYSFIIKHFSVIGSEHEVTRKNILSPTTTRSHTVPTVIRS